MTSQTVAGWIFNKNHVEVTFRMDIDPCTLQEFCIIVMDIKMERVCKNGMYRNFVITKCLIDTPSESQLVDILESMYQEGIEQYYTS